MGVEQRLAVLSEDVRTVVRGDDALMHNIANGSWCRVSGFAADFFARQEGISLAREAAVMGNGEAVGMLRMAAELADTGMLVEKGSKCKSAKQRISKAYLIVTRRCNLNCPSCYMGESANSDHTLGSILSAVGKLRLLKPAKVYITGGEPCAREDLPSIISALKGIKAVLCTNGTMPERIPYELLKSLGMGLQISVESCIAAEHDGIRGAGCHKIAAELAAKAAALGIDVEIVPTITPGSKLEIDRMLRFAGSLGTGCHGSLMVNVGRGKEQGTHDESGLLASIAQYLGKCVERGEIDDSSILEDIMPMLSKASCGAGSRIISCTGDGQLHPCHLLWDRPLSDAELLADVDRHPVCALCDVRYLCGGGCKAAAMANGGLDPNCATYKAVYSAFAWNWDDSLKVSENIRRMTEDANKDCIGVPCCHESDHQGVN